MDRTNLVEIKKGETGTGILIENDGFISSKVGDNQKLFEDINSGRENGDFYCPKPFIVSAVFQKFGLENANGRIYPESVLKREVEKYQKLIQDRAAIGECYRPEAMVLTETGWKHLFEVKIGENILTLNTKTNEIEIQPIKNVVKYHYSGKMININGRQINDVVTPDHGYPLFDRNHKFRQFVTAKELMDNDSYSHFYIPKTGEWVGRNDEYMIIPKIEPNNLSNRMKKELREKYSSDLVIPMDVFAKFMGIYLSEGSHSKKTSKSNKVNIHQKKESVCVEIEKMLEEWGIPFTVNTSKTGAKTFVISDMRLCKYVEQFGLCYDKFVPFELKQQSKEILRIFYDWFVLGDGRIRGDKRRTKKSLSDDVFSTSKRLALDLNEIQLKIGYSGTFSVENRNYDRIIEDRIILGENSHDLYFSYKSLTNGIYTDKRFMTTNEVDYDGDVMCVEVDNHIWYVMDNNRCHWTKNCNHPSESVIDLSRTAINITELHWEGHTLVGKMEVLISEGFRRYGLITCQGDQVAHLLLSGIKIGVSSRGLGTVSNKMGTLYVADDYEIICWDVVSSPSTNGAYISTSGIEGLQPYIESKENDETRLIDEKINKFNDWLI
jgi:hypothetical protein